METTFSDDERFTDRYLHVLDLIHSSERNAARGEQKEVRRFQQIPGSTDHVITVGDPYYFEFSYHNIIVVLQNCSVVNATE
jgi:hypothetical protein